MEYVTKCVYFILFLFCAHIGMASSDCPILDKLFYIRNRASGLVLDASDYRGVRVQTFDQSSARQKFQLHPASRTGLFNIFSPDDLFNEVLTYLPTGQFLNEGNLTLDLNGGSLYQQWFLNSDGTIMNAGLNGYGLTVDGSPFYSGSYVVVAEAGNFGTEQTFQLTNEHYPTSS